ncbi:EAL domain-containing protein [Hoyosella sp. G463]|uniref:EAL domain-containing protein n=1 Tax=Lolliginicoccus lacisalsi TaxID=2742202 RepID=A0A927PMT6_9ACTN|nr:DICT sensory domain-containing protein [Lolliginicoccus lacisalsi]MBD8507082.1 EAL domain-containing protein [Lolliginicoccus lacisalsi]
MEFAGLPIRPTFAPIHHLGTGHLAAVDVQLRGEGDGPLSASAALRAVARAMSDTSTLDQMRSHALDGHPASAVPALVTVDVGSLEQLRPTTEQRGDRREIVVITDHALASDPARALRLIAAARASGKAIAGDEVGARDKTLALRPLIEPEIIILTAALIATPPDAWTAHVAQAVAAQAEHSTTIVIADGIDSTIHHERARGLGASHGMGKMHPPAASPAQLDTTAVTPLLIGTAPAREGRLPFAIAAEDHHTHWSRKTLLVELSTTLENLAATAGRDTILLGTFQHVRNFTARTRRRWESIAGRVAFAGVYGVGMGPTVEEGVHHAPLEPGEPLVEEWNVVVLAPHFCSVLTARDLHRGGRDEDREFEYALTQDRATAVRCARAILDRFDGPHR